MAHGQESLLIPGRQEAVEEADGTLAVLRSLLCHQIGWRAQEEAGEQGGCGGRENELLVRNGARERRRRGLCFCGGSRSGAEERQTY